MVDPLHKLSHRLLHLHQWRIYFADDYRDSTSYGYGKKNPIVMRAKIKSNAKTITESQLRQDFSRAQARGDKLANACAKADSSSARNLYALAKGYDCVVSSVGYRMVLNRRCLQISDKTKPATGTRW